MDDVLPGLSYPLGATVDGDGVNFSVFSKHATGMDLLLFDRVDAHSPSRVIPLSGARHRTSFYWHALVHGLHPGQLYAYRARGPFAPEHGLRYDGEKVLLDPYARAVCLDGYKRELARRPGDNSAYAPKGVVLDPRSYDWEGD